MNKTTQPSNGKPSSSTGLRNTIISPDLHEMILRIYDAAADPSLWCGVLDDVVARAGAQGSVMFEWQNINGRQALSTPFYSDFYTPEALSMYVVKCMELEAKDQAIIREHTKSHDTVELIDDTVLAESVEALKKQEHVQKLLKLGVFHRAAGVLNKDNPWISMFSLQFSIDRNNMNEDERYYLSKILPHIAKSYDLSLPMRQLNQQYSGALAAIDQLMIGICVIDNSGNIVLSNSEFERQIESYSKFRKTPNGKLLLDNDVDQQNFSAMQGHALDHGKFGARPRKEAIAVTSDSFLCIEITPIKQSGAFGSAPLDGYVVYSTDTSLPFRCNTDPIQSAFGLTNTELSIVEAIFDGLSNSEIAERRDRSVETVNTQVKSVLSKSNCNTRTQLVRMMMRFGTDFLTPSVPIA